MGSSRTTQASGGVYGTPKSAQPGVVNSGASGDKKQVGGTGQPGIASDGDTKTVK